MKRFNVTGTCYPDEHYMVDISERLEIIAQMIERGDYFCINAGRQYGKTTTLYALKRVLAANYEVYSISFEGMPDSSYANARVYQIGADVDFGYVDAIDDLCRWTLEEHGSLTLVNVVSKPFMDTNGLYIRTKYFYENGIEHATQDSSTVWKMNYTTWLFAGNKLRLVKSWEDSSYNYFHEENYEEVCFTYSQTEEYHENYMTYESGEFKLVKKTAQNIEELEQLILDRP